MINLFDAKDVCKAQRPPMKIKRNGEYETAALGGEHLFP